MFEDKLGNLTMTSLFIREKFHSQKRNQFIQNSFRDKRKSMMEM